MIGRMKIEWLKVGGVKDRWLKVVKDVEGCVILWQNFVGVGLGLDGLDGLDGL